MGLQRVTSPLSESEERIAAAIVSSAFAVNKGLGPGLLGSVYEACFCHTLTKQGFHCARQVVVPVTYDGVTCNEGFQIDVLVESLVICELKAVEVILPVHETQLLTYLKLSHKRLGFLINFNVPLIKHGIKRFVL